MKNKFLGFGFLFFVGDVISGVGLGLLAGVIGPWAQLLDRSILLKFLVDTRLKSKSFEPLIGFQLQVATNTILLQHFPKRFWRKPVLGFSEVNKTSGMHCHNSKVSGY